MKKASLLIEKGNLTKVFLIYLGFRKNAVDQSFRDIATILYVLNSMDKSDSEILLKKLNHWRNSKVWQSSALELKAFIFLKDGKKIGKEVFESILNLKSSPSSLSTRARNMIEYLKENKFEKIISFSLIFFIFFF